VFLDAETACYGDPAFDLAFCLNHLLLKCIWRPKYMEEYLACFRALANAYTAGVTWEQVSGIEARISALLPALLLARVDGKSPVEYITVPQEKSFIREFAKRHLRKPTKSVEEVAFAWQRACYSR
jgi:hypothetical protein